MPPAVFTSRLVGGESGATVTPTGLAAGAGGRLLLAGQLKGTAHLGESGPGGTLSATSDAAAFAASYRADLSLEWAARAGGAGGDAVLPQALSAAQPTSR